MNEHIIFLVGLLSAVTLPLQSWEAYVPSQFLG